MEDRVINLSDYQLSQVEKQALCLGLDFAVAPRRANIDSEFENVFHQLSDFPPLTDDDQALLRANLVQLSKSYSRMKIERSCFLPCHLQAEKELGCRASPSRQRLRFESSSTQFLQTPANFNLTNKKTPATKPQN